jgi:hypothetical protein
MEICGFVLFSPNTKTNTQWSQTRTIKPKVNGTISNPTHHSFPPLDIHVHPLAPQKQPNIDLQKQNMWFLLVAIISTSVC